MVEWRIKGLSCPQCTSTLEQEIKRLTYGSTAKLSYNSGRLIVDERVPMEQLVRILKSDGASLGERLTQPAGGQTSQTAATRAHKHDHEHGREHGHEHANEHAHTDGQARLHPHDERESANREHSHSGPVHDRDHQDHADGHSRDGHDHSHASGGSRQVIRQLVVSAAIYVGALLAEDHLAEGGVVALYIVAALLSGYSTFLRGLRNLLRFRFNIDTLMTIALVGAAAIGDWREATLVAILFGLNELLEGFGMEQARRSMETLLEVAPKEATLLEDGAERVVPIASLAAGDLVLVKPGEKIPSDGTVESGRSSVNEAAITGESLPVDKSGGDFVYGGSLNNEGALRIRIGKAYEDSSLAKILHLVREAQETKTPTELFINRFSRYYTPFIIFAAVVVCLFPPLALGGDWSKWLYQGLSVLIVGCPCALILSSPIAIVAGITRNARNGILVKGGATLEQLGKLDTLAFDKTGTLTEGRPYVARAVVYDAERFYDVAGAIERSSSHPLARAVLDAVGEAGVVPGTAEEPETIAGRGIAAVYNGRRYRLGNEKLLAELPLSEAAAADIERLKSEGLTLVIVADEAGPLGAFGIADRVREESASVVAELRRSGIRRTVMLTGDHAKTAARVAAAVGVGEYHGDLLPEHKVAKVKEMAAEGRVGMIGDGINDAPALASATLGIAMGKGADSAVETADVVLMQDHLGKLPEAIRIARRVNRIIRFNIGVALGLKLIALLLTVPGWLTLWIAILSDMGATVFVTLISLTILIRTKAR